MRATVLTPLLLLGWSLHAIGQSPARPSGEQPSIEAQSPAASEKELKLVVALFRHGVRAPLPGFEPKTANNYSRQGWPDLAAWSVPPTKGWGDLTTRGQVLATALGRYYAQWYGKNAWPAGFKVYLWADTDQRTIDTAEALNQGFQQGSIPKRNITVKSSPNGVDPLFHPFNAGCGIPDPNTLEQTVTKINKGREEAAQKLKSSFEDLYGVLDCKASPCLPLKMVVESVTTCTDGKKNSSGKCKSPITWSGMLNEIPSPGQFPYASSASEAFLLEYANSMPANLVGWERVDAAKNLHSMLQLHEAYFELTERDPYLAKIQGSNLTREIRDLIMRAAEPAEPIDSKCLRADKASQFVGLVGHDTNIAGVGKLLELDWQFDDAQLPPGEHLPPDTLNLPRKDALPAGALVFELRERAGKHFVRIEYVAQSLLQMRGDPKRPPAAPFRFNVTCYDQDNPRLNPCEMSLDSFKTVAGKALGENNPFFSRCSADGQQVCP
jgi:4-phytase/acid phosphatase